MQLRFEGNQVLESPTTPTITNNARLVEFILTPSTVIIAITAITMGGRRPQSAPHRLSDKGGT